MLINGRYVSIDGIYRPFVKASVLSPSGVWMDIPFLVDTGPDLLVAEPDGYRVLRAS